MYVNPLQNMSLSLSNPGAPRASASGGSGADSTGDPLSGSSNLFLQLLTTQLQNQSPFDPLDPNQFTEQLVQMNMLDQLSQINQTLQQIAGTTPSPANASSSHPSSAGSAAVQGAR